MTNQNEIETTNAHSQDKHPDFETDCIAEGLGNTASNPVVECPVFEYYSGSGTNQQTASYNGENR